MAAKAADFTSTLIRVTEGSESAAERLFVLLYDRFRGMARGYLQREVAGHSLHPTELVHEAYIKLIDQDRADWKSRSHFLAVGGLAMRRLLVDHANRKKRQKRGGGAERITLVDSKLLSPERDEDVLSIDEALNELEKLNERHAKIVELRFFGGLSVEEVAEVMKISDRTVRRDWVACRAWLRKRFSAN